MIDKDDLKLIVGVLIAVGLILLALWIFATLFSATNEASGPQWFKVLISFTNSTQNI